MILHIVNFYLQYAICCDTINLTNKPNKISGGNIYD